MQLHKLALPSSEGQTHNEAKQALESPRRGILIYLQHLIWSNWTYSCFTHVVKFSPLKCNPASLAAQDPSASAGVAGSTPGLGRPPREGDGNLLQYPCLGNPMDRGSWQVHRVTRESDMTWQLNNNNKNAIHYSACVALFLVKKPCVSNRWEKLVLWTGPTGSRRYSNSDSFRCLTIEGETEMNPTRA